jgi:adenylate cyclase
MDFSSRFQAFRKLFRQREAALCGVALVTGLFLTLAGLNPWVRAFVEQAEWRHADRIHLSGRLSPADEDIVLLGIDDASLTLDSLWPEEIAGSPALRRMQEGWPWSREVWALAIDRLVAAGAKSVVLDFTFGIPSTEEADTALREAVRLHVDHVVLGADHQERPGGNGGLTVGMVMPAAEVVPTSALRDVSIGHLNFWVDPGAVVRTQRPRWSLSGLDSSDPVPSLAMAIHLQQGGDAQVVGVNDEPYFRFSHPQAFSPVSFHKIFVPDLWEHNFDDGAFFKDKTVFIGVTARHFQDFVQTPVGRLIGVQTHAHALNALQRGDWLTLAPANLRLAVFWLVVLLAWILVATLRRPLWTLVIMFLFCWILFAAQRMLFNHAALMFPMLEPTLGWCVTVLFCLGYDFVLEKRRLRVFSRYFSPDMATELARNPAPYLHALVGTNRKITLLFSDVRGFTSLSETHPAEAMVAQLNQYLNRMVHIVFDHRGSIDKFIGDAIMAVWGRLRERADEQQLAEDAADGIESALCMREALRELNLEWKERGWPELAFGIGLHLGEAIVGNIGSDTRMEFTAIGDSVNEASRLEGLTKIYGTDLLVSQIIRDSARELYVFRTVDWVRVVGKTKSLEIFTVLSRAGVEPPSGLAAWEEAITEYRAGNFAASLKRFEEAATLGLNDNITDLYRNRCRDLMDHPPGTSWDGVFTAPSK